jgi:hypothetical protein
MSKVERQKTRPDPIYIDLSLTGYVSSIYYYLLLSTEQVRRWKLNKNEPNSMQSQKPISYVSEILHNLREPKKRKEKQ